MKITTIDSIRRAAMFLLTLFFLVLARNLLAGYLAADNNFAANSDAINYACINFILMSGSLAGMTGKLRLSLKISFVLTALLIIISLLGALF